jgi:hypothetical protein
MFQFSVRDRFLSTIISNILLAVLLIVGPSLILLGLIARYVVKYDDDGGLLIDLPLGTILLFSSLAAVIAPFVYRISYRHKF